MRRAIFAPQARRDLAEAWHYISEQNLSAADQLVDRIEQAVQTLAQMPGIGHQRKDVKAERYRFWPVKPYVIAYRFTSRTMTIVRVVHGARNFRRILKGNP